MWIINYLFDLLSSIFIEETFICQGLDCDGDYR